MKTLLTILWIAAASALACPAAIAGPVLFDFGLNINGTTYCDLGPCDVDGATLAPNTIPGLDTSAFDATTGLGTLTLAFDALNAGNYAVSFFVDHEIDEPINGFANEHGAVIGTPASNQHWEIDEPGAAFGDIFDEFLNNRFDHSNGVPAGSADDVSMGLGWEFALAAGERAVLAFRLSDLIAPIGFHLAHTDSDSGLTVFFGSSLAIFEPAVAVAAPGSLYLFGAIVLAILRSARRKPGAARRNVPA